MANISPSSSPRWDIRNQGFVSPAQLQQWKQQQRASTYEFSSEQTHSPQSIGQSPQHHDTRSPPPMGPAQSSSAPSTPNPQPPPAPPHTHTRTNSTFSFFKSKFQPQETPQPPPPTQTPPGHPQQRQQSVNVSLRKPNVLRRRSTDRPQEPPNPTAQPRPPGDPSPSRASTAIARQPTSGPPPLHPEIRSISTLR